MSIAFLSFPLVIPGLIGYSLGKKYSFRAIPQIFFAQPDRQDPDKTQCRFLHQNQCTVSSLKFIQGTCDNKFNQVTCSFYTKAMKHEYKNKPPKGLFNHEN